MPRDYVMSCECCGDGEGLEGRCGSCLEEIQKEMEALRVRAEKAEAERDEARELAWTAYSDDCGLGAWGEWEDEHDSLPEWLISPEGPVGKEVAT